MIEKDYAKDFGLRLSQLRLQKGVSARDMSLSIGQNAGYINNIETQKALPSMSGFFYICEYLGISPKDFFDYQISDPVIMNALVENLRYLSRSQLIAGSEIVKELIKK